MLGRSRAAGALLEISCEAGEVMDGARMGEESWAGCLPTRQEHSRAGWPEQDPGFPPFFRRGNKGFPALPVALPLVPVRGARHVT